MSKKIKKAVVILTTIILVIIAVISTFFIIKCLNNKAKIDYVIETYSDEDVQNRLENEDSILLQIDGENVIGVVKIPKINFEGLVYEGTSLDILAKGVGHFENSSYYNGNVCLAAHNYNQVWGELYTLEIYDTITYISFLGTKNYEVLTVKEIKETDWSMLQNTEDNRITLITCVQDNADVRLCVQGIEID